ncbi:calcium activated cation channel [Cryptococcus neoformans var. grubii Br795]|uniref:Calcium activated cation channel n=1 Tax=Cryptococcus neoformans Tu259-1 TaxID=1230072 RepID=A0A854QM51_CRYNE|nr:calcium activated cation channel [Cryptococcus neoformans var. grubii AD1-83a]OWZ57909.1 calcium activated cation channel [Cryptococcus neoformans var. grubii 125.91]OXG28914.1 calcium activated cation channel [Cryptococcus neoformans var. grubii Tu259-1]OXG45498.1 calcium activated cation channel [Cryptococcus neoformans var. grubii Bt120]OXG54165.1 calcium activated cation channel [Cryptococcus neoformans var. grubii Th84]OXG68818.1 calcium activated cation channel [Cryptococcus neoforman
MGDALSVEEQRSVLSFRCSAPESDTITKLVKRCRAMVVKLLPVEVELSQITDATSSIITPQVITSFAKSGGDFGEAVPFALLRAKAMFMNEANKNPADYDENLCRATAAEVLARRIVHNLPVDKLESVMSARYRYRESDGDESAPSSALETAIDQHGTIFLSSSEAQHVVNSLWRGDWIQRNNDNMDIDYVPYQAAESSSFWAHLNPDRMSVPRYQSTFKMVVWTIFLFVYSQSVQSPLESFNSERNWDGYEIVLYVMAAAFLIEEIVKISKIIRIAPRPMATVGFWTIVNLITDCLLLTAFGLRVAGLSLDASKDDQAQLLHFRSFQVLSCVAPFIWMKLLTVFDGFKIESVGTLQVVVARMLRESTIFFILLAIMGIGFVQSLYALDAADGESGGRGIVINNLIQALLGAPDFDSPSERFGYPFGLIIFYGWNFVATIILVNVLIALFGSAYSDVTDNETDEYLVFFAHKTIDLIRAPDSYVYSAPFNLIEAFLIAPFEWILPRDMYIALNRYTMTILFFVPLTFIVLFETNISHSKNRSISAYFNEPPPDEEGDPVIEDPTCEGDDNGEISRTKFESLISVFPNPALTESPVHQEMEIMRKQLDRLEKLLLESRDKPA